MAWPVGVVTREVTFSGASDGEDGSDITARAIVSLNDVLIHLPTGTPLLHTPQVFTSSFFLPVTDQAGNIWGDGYGNVFTVSEGFHTHYYNVDIEYQVNGRWVQGRKLQELVVFSNVVDPLDLDLAFHAARTVYEDG